MVIVAKMLVSNNRQFPTHVTILDRRCVIPTGVTVECYVQHDSSKPTQPEEV